MKALGIIPARYHSTRFIGKPLADICGKPMIEHVYERASKSQSLTSVTVATDDKRIARKVEEFGGNTILTSSHHKSGTDRIAEAVIKLDTDDTDLIVNIQGDQPLVEPAMIDEVTHPFINTPSLMMATLSCRIEDNEQLRNPNVVKIVIDKDGFALYFSRYPIPYVRVQGNSVSFYKHIGIYVYRKEFLLKFTKMPQSILEKAEMLEQLRALENGYKILVVKTDFDSVEVDTPQDLERVKSIIAREISF
ncbi:MAG: 3-deoxy-manno-octulosonate cytidylyltransferase [Thermodesulfobacteriota bacterium]|nr:3-deoxy-manno-octulosonate cytidylyltransferase [Thermodesulfobacteriota bacterium]